MQFMHNVEMYYCIPTPVELIKLQQINHSKVLLDPNGCQAKTGQPISFTDSNLIFLCT